MSNNLLTLNPYAWMKIRNCKHAICASRSMGLHFSLRVTRKVHTCFDPVSLHPVYISQNKINAILGKKKHFWCYSYSFIVMYSFKIQIDNSCFFEFSFLLNKSHKKNTEIQRDSMKRLIFRKKSTELNILTPSSLGCVFPPGHSELCPYQLRPRAPARQSDNNGQGQAKCTVIVDRN